MPRVDDRGRPVVPRRRRPAARPRPKPAPRRRWTPPPSPDQADRTIAARPPVTPRNPSPAFRPIASQTRPLKPQRERARQRTERAERRLPAEPRAPYRPTFSPREQLARRVAVAPPFRPIGSQARPLRVQETRANQQTRRARNRLPDHPAIPEVEGLFLKSDLEELQVAYWQAQRRARSGRPEQAQREYAAAVRELESKTPEELIGRIRDAYKSAARELGGSSINDLYQFGSLRQRRQMRRVGRIVNEYEGAKATNNAIESGVVPGRDRLAPNLPPAKLAGFPVEQIAGDVGRFLDEATRIPNRTNASLADIPAVGLNLTRATIEDPGAVARSSLRTAVESITGIPQGVKEMIEDPSGALGKIAEDYERRYGPIAADPGEFRRRVKEESGLTPFVFDAAALGVPVGRAATAVMRTGPAGRATAALTQLADQHGRLRSLAEFAESTHRAARAPRDARRLARIREQLAMAELEGDVEGAAALRKQLADAEANVRATARPALRFSGGEGGVRQQRSSPNLLVALGQRQLDRSRQKAYEKRAADSGMDVGPGGRLVTVRGRKVLRMTALRPGDREVVPKTTGIAGRSLRELPGVRRYTGRVARDLGGQQSVTRIKLLTHRGRILNRVDKALRRLDDNESTALKYMLQLGITPDQAGVRALEKRRNDIWLGRDAQDFDRIAPLLEDSNDELAIIERILDDPAAHLTPAVREVADELREIQLAEAKRDPELTADQELIRRVTPQGKLVGVTRGPDVEFFRGVLDDLEQNIDFRRATAKTPQGPLRMAVPEPENAMTEPVRRWSKRDRDAARRDLERALERARDRGDGAAVSKLEQDLAIITAADAPRPMRDVGIAEYADALASEMPDKRKGRAKRMLKGVRTQRKTAERSADTALRRLAVAEARVRQAEHRGVPYDDEEVREARAELSKARRDRDRIARDLPRQERRAGRVLGALGERERVGPPLVTDDVREARGRVSAAQKRVNRLEGQIARTERRAGRRIGEAYGRETRGRNQRALDAELDSADLERELAAAREDLRDAQLALADVEKAAPRLTGKQLIGMLGSELKATGRAVELREAELRVQAASDRLQQALADAPRTTQRQRERVQERERELAAATHVREQTRDFERAMREVVRVASSKRTMRLEDAVTFAEKVKDAAEAEGLTAPAYWWSSMMPKEMPSLAAAGQGTRAAHRNKRYKGTLFEIGAEEGGTDPFTRGIERNIKRRFQQALVTRNLETHAYEWSRGRNGEGLTIAQIERIMIDRAINPRSVELVEPRILRRRGTEEPGVQRGSVLTDEELEGLSADDFVTTTQQDLAEGRRTWEEVSNWDRKTQALHRFVVVPREVGETINGVASRMDNTFWRSMEILLKQKPARILLGAANVPWLAFQVASNAMLTGFGGGVNPFNVYAAHKWWRGLTPDQKEAVEAELGITHGHHFGMDQPSLGAVDATTPSGRMVNFWRAYKTSRVGRVGNRINPLNVMFRVDEAQNNFFRRVLFYDKSRKAAYRRMGRSWQSIDKGITRAVDRVLARPPHQQAHLIARHGAEFEAVAKHVNDFLGDYIRFTPSERFLLQRNVMFYGYLRFSLRFAFYTMPVAHPIMTAILGNIGRLGADEIKELMGVPEDYNLPTSILTQTYFGDREDAEDNELRSLPLNRFNPFLNALTQLDGMQQAIGVVSPFYQVVVDQAFEESSFTGRDWRIEGRPTPSEADRPRNYFGHALGMFKPGSPRNRIALAETLRLLYPYRVASETGIPGIVEPLEPNQSDDALLGSPRPMMYADPEAMKGVKKSRRQAEEESGTLKLARALLPVFPKRTSAPAVASRELEREAAIRERNSRKPGARKKRKRKGSTGNRYGGGSSGGRYR